MNCPICQCCINFEDIYHNSEKCSECLNIFHRNCALRINRNRQNKANCPCCRKQYNPTPLSKLERLLLKSDMKLYKCSLCGGIREKDHIYWCWCDGILKQVDQWNRDKEHIMTREIPHN